MALSLPKLPAEHDQLIEYLDQHQEESVLELLKPYNDYDNVMRQKFVQQAEDVASFTPNVVPLYKSAGEVEKIKIRARDIEAELPSEKGHYVMPLSSKDRKAKGSPAVVTSTRDFRQNFSVFTENSLSEMDWNNVVCAGSAVTTSLIPVPDPYSSSKRSMREYYHQKVAPASDVDLFLYALTENEALEKIKHIEKAVRNSVIAETTVIRTKHAITIVSEYPTRHVQIVLRIYKSISEILTGFDVDCACVAYDGKQIYASPRAIGAFMCQINTIDLSRRSPSYENRLSKYSKRGFEVYWPNLDRDKIDPTIFERNFRRTVGLARLLVLEKLPLKTDREQYQDQRRRERGRPYIQRNEYGVSRGNYKDLYEDEIADWDDQQHESNYNTFTIPYGKNFHAKRIEKLLYVKDLLLNADWNRPKDRNVHLHRHPAFFGNVENVIGDCCGYCPKPLNDEDSKVYEEESKMYISGDVKFIHDDPGRQSIGSFNPITDQEWTEMAYIGNTEKLCQAIVDHDLEYVRDWSKSDGSDSNRRDCTGRTPLQLAVMTSTDEIIQILIDSGARIVARLADGRTALHLAAMLGRTKAVSMLLNKSEQNEENVEHVKSKVDKGLSQKDDILEKVDDNDEDDDDDDDDDDENVDGDYEEESDEANYTISDGSYVKIDKKEDPSLTNLPDDSDKNEPDIYDVNITAWDTPVSPLHLAIFNGHIDTVKLLVQEYGADILRPVKTSDNSDVILPLVIAMMLPVPQAEEMMKLMISLGCSILHADTCRFTALHYAAIKNVKFLNTCLEADVAKAKQCLKVIGVSGTSWWWHIKSPLQSAIANKKPDCALALLQAGIVKEVTYDMAVDAIKFKHMNISEDDFKRGNTQPIMMAIFRDQIDVIKTLLETNIDINTMTNASWGRITTNQETFSEPIGTILDIVNFKIGKYGEYNGENDKPEKPVDIEVLDTSSFEVGSYLHWKASITNKTKQSKYDADMKQYKIDMEKYNETPGLSEKAELIARYKTDFEEIREIIIKKGGKPIEQLYPDIQPDEGFSKYHPFHHGSLAPKYDKDFQIVGLTSVQKEGYNRLFQACLDNDEELVKTLTLTIWNTNNSPLQIAVQDSNRFSPFSIAVLKGYTSLAEVIIEIAQAQFEPNNLKGKNISYHMTEFDYESEDSCGNAADSDDSYDYGSDEMDMDEPRVVSDIVDEKFTIDDLGTVHSKVKSKVEPLTMLEWECPSHELNESIEKKDDGSVFYYAIQIDDRSLLVWLLGLAAKYSKIMNNIDDNKPLTYTIKQKDYLTAIQLSRVVLLQTMIAHTGVGLPLDQLIGSSEINLKTNSPKYYQGLSVYGKKRADWAKKANPNAGNGYNSAIHPPLLDACHLGSLEVVEYLLSDTATRNYHDFASDHRDDQRIQSLAESNGNIETVIDRWLTTRSNLALHCVILGETRDNSAQLISYIIKKLPDVLEAKNDDGYTPLHLAFALQRKTMIQALIKHGANQTIRDKNGRNILHAALEFYKGNEKDGATNLKDILSLIDTRLISTLSVERTSKACNSGTPLISWLDNASRFHQPDENNLVLFLKTILDFTGGKELNTVDGLGETPLHKVVRAPSYRLKSYPLLASTILDYDLGLLWREDATGRTPYEIASNLYSAECFADIPRTTVGPGSLGIGISRERPENVLLGDQENSSQKYKMWLELNKKVSKNGRRILCSLEEANEVAKRLAERKVKLEDRENEQVVKTVDEVSIWFAGAKTVK